MARGGVHQRRFPLEPLLAVTGHPTQVRLSEIVGAHQRQVVRWVQDGGLTARWADRAACAIDLHPIVIWPAEWASELQLQEAS